MPSVIFTTKAPRPIGAYSQGLLCGDVLYVSGQLAINPLTSTYSSAPVEREADLVFRHIVAILKEAEMLPKQVVKVTIFLTRIQDFAKVNGVYSLFFNKVMPAREVVEVSALPLGAKVEVSCIAMR